MDIRYLLALHIIFIVTWFAGLFYIFRIFVYQAEAYALPGQQRDVLVPTYKKNAKTLWYGITWPSAILVFLTGFSVLYVKYLATEIPIPGWLWVKFGLLTGLYGYHFYAENVIRRMRRDAPPLTGQQFRVMNEVATIFLVAIVFLVKLQSSLDMLWGLVGLLIFTVALLVAIRLYKKIREKNQE